MLLVNLTKYSGSSWTHVDLELEFQNENELNNYIESCAAAFDDIEIKSIKVIEK